MHTHALPLALALLLLQSSAPSSLSSAPFVAAQPRAVSRGIADFGSVDASQAAADQLVFFLNSPGNCLVVNSDLPVDAPSKNLAALWIRAVFHDAGTWDPANRTAPGGMDSSVMRFFDFPDNAGLQPSIAPIFQQRPGVNITKADAIALAGLLSVTHCGGPKINYRPGRLDFTTTPTSPAGRLPGGTEAFPSVMAKLRRMNWTDEDIVVLVTGSHSMGGVHGAISPDITKKKFVPFDSTPGVFDNDVFKKTLAGICALPLDCEIAKDPKLRPLVERYANDQNAFFAQYAISFEKLLAQTRSPLMPAVPLMISVHANLLAEGTTDAEGNVITPPTTATTGTAAPTSKTNGGDGSVFKRILDVMSVWAAVWIVYSQVA
ncbi:heme peroxidase [Entophlyctis helioformis]|nr:heme peroxidase [Entophlyctis helioformis]